MILPDGDFDRFFVVDVPIQSENGGTTECVGFLYSSSYDGAKPSKTFGSPHCDDTLRFLYGMKAPELADLLNQWRSCNPQRRWESEIIDGDPKPTP